jgi:two-component system, chemotaxis family, CheB/CheR fusion protein
MPVSSTMAAKSNQKNDKKKAKTAIPKAQAIRKPAPAVKPAETKTGFPLIGIGASAGGLEAFEIFFKNVPADSGMAFVLVSHLDPSHASMLTEILQRITAIKVVEAGDQMAVAPDHVYIIPPNREMTIFHGVLQLSVPGQQRGLRMPIDTFLRSLAEDVGEKTIAVILSGTGTDGTLGLRAVQGAGGVSFVQDPATAKYDGMPTSAIQSGLATYILPADKMFGEIAAYVRNYISRKIPLPLPAPEGKQPYAKILMLLRTKTRHDFSLYKLNTIRRRIERRMDVHNLTDPGAYARYLAENPAEVHVLFKELLINVTSFFRDPEAFEVLKSDIIPGLLENKPEDYVFRVWVAGCATGEEAYSIAMIFRECIDAARHSFRVQIYATDIDDDAIAVARVGFYPENIAIDVHADRLRRFFVKEETGFRIKKEIREMVIFAVQDVIRDPPFTRLDLLSCRNLLIYFEPELQNRLIPMFHYALNPTGVLFLSPSESIGKFTDLFSARNRKWKFYTTRPSSATARATGDYSLTAASVAVKGAVEIPVKPRETNFVELTRGILLQSYAPPSVITDEEGNTLFVHGDTGKFLRPAPGAASLNIIEMAREGLQLELRKAIRSAVKQKTHVTISNLPVRTNGGMHPVDIIVRPLPDPGAARNLLIVSFQDAGYNVKEKALPVAVTDRKGQTGRVHDLEQELQYTKEHLQATIIGMQGANEELKSANEELQSMNEELQSTNEELETSKEELQSVNEEIVTVNAELQAKIEQLTDIQNDMKNLLDSTSIATIFLDETLKVKRFTREASRLYRLIATDVGRPLADIKSILVSADIVADAQEVLDTMVPQEKEVQTEENLRYLTRLTPYRTLANVIEGVVITFTDITTLKSMETEARSARELAENVINTIREPLIVLDPGFKIVSASRSFYSTFHAIPIETIGHSLFDIGNGEWDIPRLRELLETVLPENSSFDEVEVDHDFPGRRSRKMLLNGRQVRSDGGGTRFILLAMQDVTDIRCAEEELKTGNRRMQDANIELTAQGHELRENETRLTASLEEKEVLLAEVHHRVKNNLAAFISLLALDGTYEESPAGQRLKTDLQNRARSMALIHETLYKTRKFSSVDMDVYLSTLTEQIAGTYQTGKSARTLIDAKGISLDLSRATPTGLIVNELITNTFKYAFPASFDCMAVRHEPCTLRVSLALDNGMYTLRVGDNGVGLPAEYDPKKATSLGLKLVNFLARHQLRAKIEVNTEKGTEYIFRFSDKTRLPKSS